jgi:hypothetical protein
VVVERPEQGVTGVDRHGALPDPRETLQ